jgi:hypothetical protein
MWMGDTLEKKGSHIDDMKLQFLIMWIVGSALILAFCAGLKRVRVDENFLYVSNYLREISVPLDLIIEVTEIRWLNIHPVAIYFRDATEFGRKITFMPTTRIFGFFSSHPVVSELRGLAGLS